ncbi:MAG: mannose-6-phosphate isomerase [Frankiaceae bacterium]|nr:mannose-6-phosphate isomerase [Frankiaceae bacterium]
MRASRTATREASLDVLGFQTRPRAIVVAGMGGSGISGDVLAAVAGMRCPVPIVVHRGYGLPGWVGAADLVIAVSCSGTTAETLTAAVEAARRGTSLLGVGSADSPLEEHCRNGGGGFVPIVKELSPRSSLWALTVPMLITASRYGLVDLGPDDADLEAAAMQLESAATLCSPDRESFTNPAKALAAELAGSLPLVWGTGQVGPVAAQRMVCQIAENAKLPAIAGGLPEAHHNQVVAFDGALAAGNGDDDLFRDRVEEEDPLRLRLLLLRDDDNDELAKKRAHASADVAAGRGIKVSVLGAQGESPLERIASLVGIADFASVYLGLAYGVNPTPIAPIDELKQVLQDPRTL